MLLEKIQTLLDGPAAGRGGPSRRHVEDLLTEGYARALALEAERARIDKRIRETALGGGVRAAEEVAALARRLAHADEELAQLRGKLTTLRAHALA